MSGTAFDPCELTTDASLNHVILGSYGPNGTSGRLAQDTCSRNALHTLATHIGLTGLRPDHLADDLAAALAAIDPTAHQAAAASLHAYGLRLGALVSTLRDPATPARQAASPYRRAFLEHWLTIDSIWLAGGLLAGRCGPRILDAVNAMAGLAPMPCHVGLLRRPELAPLTGAARHANPGNAQESVVVADLGHTRIKTSIAERRPGTSVRLRQITTYPAPVSAVADEVEGTVVAVLIPAVQEAARSSTGQVQIVISVASFVQNGLPADDGQGLYGCLGARTSNLVHRIEAATGVSAQMRFVHDGTAAASAATASNSATITAGTWLGVGFLITAGSPPPNIGHDHCQRDELAE